MTHEQQAYGTSMDVTECLTRRAREIDTLLMQVLADMNVSNQFRDVLDYAMSSPGKRIRAVLLLWTYEMITGEPANDHAKIAAAAVEMVHTYSLIHDDLPAMDNDDFRRGRPTCHKAFDEAMAILAGDGLLTLAFELLADRVDSPELSVALIRTLAQNAGPDGMIAGQVADLKAEAMPTDLTGLQYIHINKTAKMFACAAVMGALCAKATDKQIDSMREFGLKIGLGFQIADDILDVNASTEQLGKTAGKDEKAGKTTYPSLLGIPQALARLEALTQDAIRAVAGFGEAAEPIRELARVLLTRKK